MGLDNGVDKVQMRGGFKNFVEMDFLFRRCELGIGRLFRKLLY